MVTLEFGLVVETARAPDVDEDRENHRGLAGREGRRIEKRNEQDINEVVEQRAEKDAKNPEAWQTIAVYYQDEARKDSRLKDAEKKDEEPKKKGFGLSKMLPTSGGEMISPGAVACHESLPFASRT